MRSSRFAAAILLAVLSASSAGAQNIADLEPVEIIVDRAGDNSPVVGQPVRIRVRVTNHGPDEYDGTTQGKARRYNWLQGGRLGITIDIDEPSKPDPGFSTTFASMFTDSFAVNIAVNDTVTLDFGTTSFTPIKPGEHGITALTIPGAGNIDPMSGNNLLQSTFDVLPVVPALAWFALALVVVALVFVAQRRLADAGGVSARGGARAPKDAAAG